MPKKNSKSKAVRSLPATANKQLPPLREDRLDVPVGQQQHRNRQRLETLANGVAALFVAPLEGEQLEMPGQGEARVAALQRAARLIASALGRHGAASALRPNRRWRLLAFGETVHEVVHELQRTGRYIPVRSTQRYRGKPRNLGDFNTRKHVQGHVCAAFKTGALNHSATHPTLEIK